MSKLIVLLAAFAAYLRFRFRRNRRVRQRLFPWLVLFVAALLLLSTNVSRPGRLWVDIALVKLAVGLGLLGYLAFDVRRVWKSSIS